MLALSSDVLVVAIGGVLAALTTAAFAFAGVLVSVRTQKKPTVVEAANARAAAGLVDELDVARILIDDLTAQRDQWRELALAWIPKPPPPAA